MTSDEVPVVRKVLYRKLPLTNQSGRYPFLDIGIVRCDWLRSPPPSNGGHFTPKEKLGIHDGIKTHEIANYQFGGFNPLLYPDTD